MKSESKTPTLNLAERVMNDVHEIAHEIAREYQIKNGHFPEAEADEKIDIAAAIIYLLRKKSRRKVRS